MTNIKDPLQKVEFVSCKIAATADEDFQKMMRIYIEELIQHNNKRYKVARH